MIVLCQADAAAGTSSTGSTAKRERDDDLAETPAVKKERVRERDDALAETPAVKKERVTKEEAAQDCGIRFVHVVQFQGGFGK